MERASILVENGDTVLTEHLYFPFQPAPVHPGSRKPFVFQHCQLRAFLSLSAHFLATTVQSLPTAMTFFCLSSFRV